MSKELEKVLINSQELSYITSIPVSTIQRWTRNQQIPYISNGRKALYQPDKVIPAIISLCDPKAKN